MAWEPDYVTLAEAKSYLDIADSADDARLALWITTASRSVDKFCHRQFGIVAAPETRTYRPVYQRAECAWVTEIDDLMTTVGMVVLDAAAAVLTGYTLGPDNAAQKGRPFRYLYGAPTGVTITATWGWTAVPAAVKAATLLQVARLAARKGSPFGIAGSPTEGSELRLLATLDPDLKTSLDKYRREWWAA